MKYVPGQGDIIWMNLSPTLGVEQSGHRPCYVLSRKRYNTIGLVLICPITSKRKGYGVELMLPSHFQTRGFILTNHVKSLDWKIRKARFSEKTSQDFQDLVYEMVNPLIKPEHKN